ncbi:MAG: hypothetical protein K0R41_1622, partial [Geminicoccaceae bacterium]|nr:hypothetical protein [Geminicoccaceae bacterium]
MSAEVSGCRPSASDIRFQVPAASASAPTITTQLTGPPRFMGVPGRTHYQHEENGAQASRLSNSKGQRSPVDTPNLTASPGATPRPRRRRCNREVSDVRDSGDTRRRLDVAPCGHLWARCIRGGCPSIELTTLCASAAAFDPPRWCLPSRHPSLRAAACAVFSCRSTRLCRGPVAWTCWWPRRANEPIQRRCSRAPEDRPWRL